ncbi:hypothetical protein HM1_1701 [Heliomicrobium modesticaldum Ice1]|uniref:Uncharacterized protein n=1 Tax=Heliobacterium modesticaldum (strain ATCC 51547 / Ice1) TaxID=498761 RepID=B0TE76_HELMI|nr:hypothetical protein HM1_1701 [Heliomicrobium modesticaldum Ice1]
MPATLRFPGFELNLDQPDGVPAGAFLDLLFLFRHKGPDSFCLCVIPVEIRNTC